MATCPNCKCTFTAKATVKKPAAVEERDGVTWYGRLVNFTTGARLSYTTFIVKEKNLRKYEREPAPVDIWQPTSSTCWQLAYQQGLRLLYQHYGNKEAI